MVVVCALHLAPKSVRPLLMLAKGELGDIDFGDIALLSGLGLRDSAGMPTAFWLLKSGPRVIQSLTTHWPRRSTLEAYL